MNDYGFRIWLKLFGETGGISWHSMKGYYISDISKNQVYDTLLKAKRQCASRG